jgi:hypothetical protein
MSAISNSYHSTQVESFMMGLKVEGIHLTSYKIFGCCPASEGVYNAKRLHSPSATR